MSRIAFRLALTGLAAGLSLALLQPAAQAAEAGPKPPALTWSFSGPFGKFDRAQLQRGFKVFKEVCASCHGASLVAFRNLSQPGGPEFTPGQVAALAATYQIKDGPNEAGEMFERPGRPAEQATVETQQAGDAGDEILVERNDRGERLALCGIAQPKPMLACRVGDDHMASFDPRHVGEQSAERARINRRGGRKSIRRGVENDRDGGQLRAPDDRV